MSKAIQLFAGLFAGGLFLVAPAGAETPASSTPPASGSALEVQWETIYGSPDEPQGPAHQGFQTGPAGLVVSPAGDAVYLAGYERTLPDEQNFGVLVALSSTGERQWTHRIPGTGARTLFDEAVGVSPDGSRVFLVGTNPEGAPDFRPDLATYAIDATNGQQLWESVFHLAEERHSSGALVVSPDGSRVFVNGSVWTGPRQGVTIAYDAVTGSEEWVSIPNDMDSLTGVLLEISPDGQTVYSGFTARNDLRNTLIVAYDAATGDELWRAEFADPTNPNGEDVGTPKALTLSPSGDRVFVAASTGSGGLAQLESYRDYAVIAFDSANGEELWNVRYDAPHGGSESDPAHNIPFAIAASESLVFVSGWSPEQPGNRNYAMTTVAFDPETGDEVWVDRFDTERESEGASDMALSPDGSILYVNGGDAYLTSGDVSKNATIAYHAATGTRVSVAELDDSFYNIAGLSWVTPAPDGEQVFVGGGFYSTEQADETGDGWDYVVAALEARFDLAIAPDPLDFGEIPVGETSDPQSVTLINVRAEDVTVDDVAPPGAPFAAAGGSCGTPPFTLSPESSCTLDYTFTPSEVGSFTADVSLTLSEPSVVRTLVLRGTARPAEIDVDPNVLQASVTTGETTTQALSLANDGGDTLEWEITEEEVLTPGASRGGASPSTRRVDHGTPALDGSPEAAPRAAAEESAGEALTLASVRSSPLPGLRVIDPVNGLVDCDSEPGIIVHDDGTVENGYAGNPDAGVTEMTFVDEFTPSAYPATFRSVCVAFVTVGPESLDFELVAFDDDGPDGGPGTELGSLPVTAEGIPGTPGTPVWFSYDIAALGIRVDAGSVFIGARWGTSPPIVFLASDESPENPPGFAGGYRRYNVSDVWAPLESSFPDYRSLMVRAVEDEAAPLDCTLPEWLTADPMSGSVPAGEARDVSVTFDATSQAPGEYEGLLCLASNDPERPLTLVPLSMTVTEPVAELTFDPASLDFGDVELGETSPPRTAMLHNSGGVDLTGLSFSGVAGTGFDADASACGDGLPVDASCPVSVTFTPAEAEPAEAMLQATSAEAASASVGLTGDGTGEAAFTPTALAVDPGEVVSDGNGVFEPGEVVDVVPTWRNDGNLGVSLTGTASAFGGPEGPLYSLRDESADYGLVEPGDAAACEASGVCYRLGVDDPAARPATHWVATFDETLDDSDGTTKTWTLHVGDSFPDVPRESPFYTAIETLLHHDVTGGCSDTEYCSAGVNTRAQMAIFLLRAMEDGAYVPEACEEGNEAFLDVPADSLFCPWIEELAAREVTSGCGGDNYCPSDSVTRAQMAIFLLKAALGGDHTPPACSGEFDDVDCSSPFAAWIEDLADRGVTAGCGGGDYCPADAVTRAQMAVFVTEAFGLTLYGP